MKEILRILATDLHKTKENLAPIMHEIIENA